MKTIFKTGLACLMMIPVILWFIVAFCAWKILTIYIDQTECLDDLDSSAD
jgi:hypothetical protein